MWVPSVTLGRTEMAFPKSDWPRLGGCVILCPRILLHLQVLQVPRAWGGALEQGTETPGGEEQPLPGKALSPPEPGTRSVTCQTGEAREATAGDGSVGGWGQPRGWGHARWANLSQVVMTQTSPSNPLHERERGSETVPMDLRPGAREPPFASRGVCT